jgi:hypothetical protein
MLKTAEDINRRFEREEKPERFSVFDKRNMHPEWYGMAEQSMMRVRDVWASVGLVFPFDEVMQSW